MIGRIFSRCHCCDSSLTTTVSSIVGVHAECARSRYSVRLSSDADLLAFSRDADPTVDVVCHRDPIHGARTNVFQYVLYHSPTGLEWGYGGSGPADFALNILLRAGAGLGRALALHQDFKREFVTRIPSIGGRISATVIETWLQRQARFDLLEIATESPGHNLTMDH